MRARFCPACGAALGDPTRDGGVVCPKCGRTHYENPAPTVGAVIVRAGKALITERARDPFKGRYDIPGGFLHVGEDALEGLRREVREELGVEIEVAPGNLLGASPHRYGEGGDWVLSFGFWARLTSGDPAPGDDVASYRWTGFEDLDRLEFAWEHDREVVRKALSEHADGWADTKEGR